MKRKHRIYGMFVGRFQPFHEGHLKMVEKILKREKYILIAVLDTEISEKNPYTFRQRKMRISKELEKWKDRVKIIKIPQIYGFYYGRNVGLKIQRIKLDAKTERITATGIRA